MNSKLPPEIVVVSAEKVPSDFHARFSVEKKEYRYLVYSGKTADPFKRNFALHYPFKLDIEAMQRAASKLIGEHDFTSFCSAKTEVEDKVRTIFSIEIIVSEDEITFSYIGNGFLYNMIRILTGTLLEVGRGKYSEEDVKRNAGGEKPIKAGKTAAPQGFVLMESVIIKKFFIKTTNPGVTFP